jgi:hypothetical protein
VIARGTRRAVRDRVSGIDVDRWGNPVFDVMPDGGLLVSVVEESNSPVRVVLGFGESSR